MITQFTTEYSIIARFDLVAVQEVSADLKGLEELVKLLDPGWDYFVTDSTDGSAGGGERMAFLYGGNRNISLILRKIQSGAIGKPLTGICKLLADLSKSLTDLSESLTDLSKLFTDPSRSLTDISKLFADTSRSFADISKLFADPSRSFTDINK